MNAHTRLAPSILAAAAFGIGIGRHIHFNTPAVEPEPLDAPTEDPIGKLRTEFSQLHADGEKFLKDTADREPTKEEQDAQDKRFTRMKAIQKKVDNHVQFASVALKEDPTGSKGKVRTQQDPTGRQEFARHEGQIRVGETFDKDAHIAALNKFAQTGNGAEQTWKFAVTSSTGSGAYLPKQILQPTSVRRLRNAYRNLLAAYGVEPIETTTMSAFSIPVEDDTANTGQAQSEGATSGTVLDPTDASLAISPTLYSSKQRWWSNTVVLASGFDVQAFTLPELQKRIDRIQNSAWTTYLLANATVGKTLAADDAMTYLELIDWEHSLAPAYRVDAGFIVSDSLFKLMRGMVDENNRPLFEIDPMNQFAGKIHNKPVIVDDYMTAVAANAKVGAFVSAEALKIVDVQNARLATYRNDSAHPDQVGFELFQNGDFKFITQGCKLLQMGAS